MLFLPAKEQYYSNCAGVNSIICIKMLTQKDTNYKSLTCVLFKKYKTIPEAKYMFVLYRYDVLVYQVKKCKC